MLEQDTFVAACFLVFFSGVGDGSGFALTRLVVSWLVILGMTIAVYVGVFLTGGRENK